MTANDSVKLYIIVPQIYLFSIADKDICSHITTFINTKVRIFVVDKDYNLYYTVNNKSKFIFVVFAEYKLPTFY